MFVMFRDIPLLRSSVPNHLALDWNLDAGVYGVVYPTKCQAVFYVWYGGRSHGHSLLSMSKYLVRFR